MGVDVETRPVGPADLPELAALFGSARTTRHCWCMSFCVPPRQFALGWLTGGNRRRFTDLAEAGEHPMGILASLEGTPVGWCACGPRSRYAAATSPSNPIMSNRDPDEDESAWLLPCVFVRVGHRSRGVSHALIGAAVELARGAGAPAIEGWPLAAAGSRSADAFVGREQVFAALGFQLTGRPAPGRVVMRLDLARD